MPVMDGIEATRRLPRQRVLILTTFGLDEYIIDALRAGASGFLLKDAPTEEVVHAVRAVAAGDAVLAPAVTRQLLDQVGRRLPAAVSRAPDELAQLTEREQQVLRMLAAGLTNAEISDGARPLRSHRQDPRLEPARQARAPRPRPSRDLRLRNRPHRPRRPLTAPNSTPRTRRLKTSPPAADDAQTAQVASRQQNATTTPIRLSRPKW